MLFLFFLNGTFFLAENVIFSPENVIPQNKSTVQCYQVEDGVESLQLAVDDDLKLLLDVEVCEQLDEPGFSQRVQVYGGDLPDLLRRRVQDPLQHRQTWRMKSGRMRTVYILQRCLTQRHSLRCCWNTDLMTNNMPKVFLYFKLSFTRGDLVKPILKWWTFWRLEFDILAVAIFFLEPKDNWTWTQGRPLA